MVASAIDHITIICGHATNEQTGMSTTELERGAHFRHRNNRDRSLTVRPDIHTVNPQHPARSYTIPAEEYSRHRNKLSSNSIGMFGRGEVTGKRKVIAHRHDDMSVHRDHHIMYTPADENADQKPQHVEGIQEYPNIVGIADDRQKFDMGSVEQTQQDTDALQKASNRNAEKSNDRVK